MTVSTLAHLSARVLAWIERHHGMTRPSALQRDRMARHGTDANGACIDVTAGDGASDGALVHAEGAREVCGTDVAGKYHSARPYRPDRRCD